MSEFLVKWDELQKESDAITDIGSELKRLAGQLTTVKASSLAGGGYQAVMNTLIKIGTNLGEESGTMHYLGEALGKIAVLYQKTEHEVSGWTAAGGGGRDDLPAVHTPEGKDKGFLKSILDTFMHDIKDEWWKDFISSALESGGNFLVRIGGMINDTTAVARSAGENAFIIINPNVAATTSKIIKNGNWIATGAKYGLPIIGGLIDFGTQLMSGEDVKDAAVKAGVHVAVGVGIGAVVGSIIPGPGTVIGAAAGFVVSTGVSLLVSTTFDYIYDNWENVKETASEAWEATTTVVSNVVEGIGDAVFGFIDNLGTIFG